VNTAKLPLTTLTTEQKTGSEIVYNNLIKFIKTETLTTHQCRYLFTQTTKCLMSTRPYCKSQIYEKGINQERYHEERRNVWVHKLKLPTLATTFSSKA
jgi:hypothetical protein